jgi:hypothetical protein
MSDNGQNIAAMQIATAKLSNSQGEGSALMMWRILQYVRRRSPQRTDSRFAPVVPSARLIEFRGTLPRFAVAEAAHHLFCQRIAPKLAQTLLAEGFRGNGTGEPTHAIYCTVYLARDKGSPRCLFNVYLALSNLASKTLEDWVAAKITLDLKHALVTRRDPWFLIRCTSDREFPWCLEGGELDDFWLTEAAVSYRFYIRRVSAIAVLNWEEEDITFLQ